MCGNPTLSTRIRKDGICCRGCTLRTISPSFSRPTSDGAPLTGNDGGGEALPFVRPILGPGFTVPDHVLAEMGRYSNDADPLLAGTWQAAASAAACAIGATRAVMNGDGGAAYALARPPGHHAGPDNFGGYCYLNNSAIAAELVTAAGGRAATLDVDTHAGNGTQAVFWRRGDVLSVSLHIDPSVEYPYFQGYPGERGAGDGEGYNHNLTMGRGTQWPQYEPVLEQACRLVDDFGPDIVVVALGVDTAVEDGVLALEGDDYLRLGERLARLGRPTVLVQEAGTTCECSARTWPRSSRASPRPVDRRLWDRGAACLQEPARIDRPRSPALPTRVRDSSRERATTSAGSTRVTSPFATDRSPATQTSFTSAGLEQYATFW